MASNMTAALSANSSDTLEAIEKEFKATQSARQNQPRFAPQKCRHRGAERCHAEIAGAGRGQIRRLQDSPARNSTPTITARSFSNETAQAQCRPRRQRRATGRPACRPRPTPRPGRRARRFRWRPRSCWRLAASPWSDPCCSSGSMSAATSCGGSAACNVRCSFCPTATLNRKFIAPASATRSRRWRTRWRFSARA